MITWATKHSPKIHFRCAVIAHLEHNYSAPRSGAKKNLKQVQCSNEPPGLRLTSQTSQKYEIL